MRDKIDWKVEYCNAFFRANGYRCYVYEKSPGWYMVKKLKNDYEISGFLRKKSIVRMTEELKKRNVLSKEE